MLQYVPSEEHLADILTKSYGQKSHNKLNKLVGINLGAYDIIEEEDG